MLQGQSGSSSRQRSLIQRGPLLPRHPLLTPIVLLSSSVVAAIASLFADNTFPILTLLGVSSFSLYLLFALVFGIAGILASIISVLEYIDRHNLQAAMFPKPKEHSYANRN
jgi:hypothetical protein